MTTIIKNTTVVTQNARREILRGAFLLIENGLVQKISLKPLRHPSAGRVVDGADFIIFPGFINAHVHLGESIYKFFLKGKLDLKGYLKATESIVKRSPLVEERRRTVSNYSSMLLLKSGTTAVCGGRTGAAGEAWGMKNVSGYMMMKSSKLGKYYPEFQHKFAAEYAAAQRSRFTKPAIFIHSLNTIDRKALVGIRALRDKFPGLPVIIHLSETRAGENEVKRKFGKSSTRVLHDAGLLEKKTLVVHCNWLGGSDFDLIKKAGATIVHCPSSNLRVDDGILDLAEPLRRGIPMCLGTDGLVTGGSLDVLAEARFTHDYHNRRADRLIVSAAECLDMITIAGARALGLDRIAGSVEEGKGADLVFIRKSNPLISEDDPIGSLIRYAHPSMIDGVMMNGSFKVWHGKFPHEKAVTEEFLGLARKIKRQLGR